MVEQEAALHHRIMLLKVGVKSMGDITDGVIALLKDFPTFKLSIKVTPKTPNGRESPGSSANGG